MSSFAQPATSNTVVSTPSTSPSWVATAVPRIRDFIIRRRVPITGILFSSLMIHDVVSGHKPHDILNLADSHTLVGLALILTGVTLRSWAAGVLCKETMLTRTGPYSLIRNPLYAGSFLMMFGLLALVGNTGNLLIVAGPMIWLYLFKVRDEEQGLAERFPAEWEQYAAETPRFFPRRITAAAWRDWNLAQWLGGREYRAVGGTLITFGLLKIWRIL